MAVILNVSAPWLFRLAAFSSTLLIRSYASRMMAPRSVSAPARCPNCGSENNLRFEYRYNLLGLAADGSPILGEGTS